MSSSAPLRIKIVVIGDASVGKSCLLLRFIDDTFDGDQPPTIGVDFKMKDIVVDHKKVRMAIWDTTGQERFRTLTSSYYRGSHGVVLTYDVTRRSTFANLDMWQAEVEKYSTTPNIVKMLVANKIDLPREVSHEEGLEYARRHGLLFVETSAKTSRGVEQAFRELVEKVVETPSLHRSQGGSDTVTLGNGDDSEEGGVCAC